MSSTPKYLAWASEAQELASKINPAIYGKVGVLLGGRSAEREVSLQSGEGVLSALRSLGIDAHPFDPGIENIADLPKHQFNRIFISLHGRFGEDGTMQGLLEQLQIPYTGSGVLASAIAIDKKVTKNLWLSQGLSTPQFAMLTSETNPQELEQQLGLPMIVKPAREGSSLGLTKVKAISELTSAYQLAAKMDRDVMAEECIIGEELTCPMVGFGHQIVALPMIRIQAPESNYDYHNKYVSNDTQYICPPNLDPQLEKEIEDLAVNAYRSLGCAGWGRADVMINRKTNKPYLLEMNTSPGMTSHSLVPMAAKQAGVSYEKLVLWILHQTLKEIQ
jgi:D-alanine-D-alanine ligase